MRYPRHRSWTPALLAGIALAAVVTSVASGTLIDDIRIGSEMPGYPLLPDVLVAFFGRQ